RFLSPLTDIADRFRANLSDSSVLAAYTSGYRWVNEEFVAVIRSDSAHFKTHSILVNDFHFSLLPRFLKDAIRTRSVTFFLHVPFPSTDLIQVVLPAPVLYDLIDGMCSADTVGFQTVRDREAFRELAARIRKFPNNLRVCPATVDAAQIEAVLSRPQTLRF